MDFEIAVIGVGLARQQALEFPTCGLGAQFFEARLGFGDDGGVILGFAQLNQFERIGDLPLDAAIARYRLVEPGAFTQQLLRAIGIVPETRVLDFGVQFGEAAGRGIPVKDASSAAPATF